MDSHDKFNREIPAPVYQKLLAIGKNLERRGFKESSKKPNLFYRNSGDGVVFADMRGTEDVPIWENPVPLIYFGKEELWRRTRLRESIIKELSTEQIPYRFSFYSGSASFELVESGDVYELDTIHREAFADNLFRLFWGVFDDPPDGYCKTCGGDFQKDLYFCSKKCENEGAIDAFLRSVDMAPSCQICNIKELALPYPEFNEYLSNNSIRYVKRLLTHHISYPVEGSAERTIRVCPKCHSRIHNSEEPALKDLKPPAGHSKKFYVKDVSKKGAVTFCGWCQYEWVARTNHPIRCPKCRGEFIVRRFSDSYSCPHCTYPFSKFDDFMEHTRREKSVILEREEKEPTGTRVKCRHCGYEWTYTGGAKRTVCPNCEGYVNTGRDIAEVKQEEDPLDPMNTPARPGMTKEEIFDLMAAKLIRKGEKITPEMKRMMEHLAEMTAKELEKKPGDEGDHDPGKEEKK